MNAIKNFIKISDLPADLMQGIIVRALELKKGQVSEKLKDKIGCLIFASPSLRTKLSFTCAILKLSGKTVFLGQHEIGLGTRESSEAIAKVISRMADFLIIRAKHKYIEDIVSHCNIPVINALSELEHPCQALSDMLTITEIFGTARNRKIVYIGDGNNVARSLAYAAAGVGAKFVAFSPENYSLENDLSSKIKSYVPNFHIQLFKNTQFDRVSDADVVYTDVWVSMGEEDLNEEKIKYFNDFQVNMSLLNCLGNSKVVFMHCLPAHSGKEVTQEVLSSQRSVVYQQAENRMWTQAALLEFLL